MRADSTSGRIPLPAQFYTVDGYAPVAAQMLMLRYWKTHGQPHTLHTIPGLPVNDVVVEARGREAIRVGATDVSLERFVVDGVVWGKETMWLDGRGSLAADVSSARAGPQEEICAISAPAGTRRVRASASGGARMAAGWQRSRSTPCWWITPARLPSCSGSCGRNTVGSTCDGARRWRWESRGSRSPRRRR